MTRARRKPPPGFQHQVNELSMGQRPGVSYSPPNLPDNSINQHQPYHRDEPPGQQQRTVPREDRSSPEGTGRQTWPNSGPPVVTRRPRLKVRQRN